MNDHLDLESIRERKSRSTRGRRRAIDYSQSADGQAVQGAFAHGARRLFVIRESAEYAMMLMMKMIEQTLWPFRDEANVKAVLEQGTTPLARTEEGQHLRRAWQIRVLRLKHGRGKELGVLFRVGDDWFLYALTSAGKTSFDGENEFTAALISAIEELRPAEVIAGPFSRLARRQDIGARLVPALKTARTLVRTFEVPTGIDLGSIGGRSQWDALLNAAEWDYQATLSRLLTGTVYELKNNRYPRSASFLPPGYTKRGGDGEHKNEVTLDLARREDVRLLIELAASDLSAVAIAEKLGKAGFTARGNYDTPADEVANRNSLVNGLFEYLPVYLNGRYDFQHEMTLTNVDEFHGIPVERHAPQDNGYLRFELQFPLPKGGWHDEELIRRAIQRRLIDRVEKPRPPRTEQKLKPLASMGYWIEDSYEYYLHTDEKTYLLRRRPVNVARPNPDRGRTGFGRYTGELLARFPADILHRSLADALARASREVRTDQPCPSRRRATEEEIAAATTRAEQLESEADAARDEVVKAGDEQTKDRYRDLAKSRSQEATRLRLQVADLERTRAVGPVGLVEGAELPALVAILRNTEDLAPAEVNGALRRLIPRFEVSGARPREPLATMSFDVQLKTTSGAVQLGPVEVPVVNHAVGEAPGKPGYRQAFVARNKRLAELLLLGTADQDEIDALWASERFDTRAYTRRMLEIVSNLVPTRSAASALIDCPLLDLRRAILGPLLGVELEHALPDDLAQEARRIYLSDSFWWPPGWCSGGMTHRRMLLKFLDTYAGANPDAGIERRTIVNSLPLTDPTLYGYLHDEGRASYHAKRSTPTYRVVEDAGGWLSRNRTRHAPHPVRVLACPHCGERKLIQPLKVPEAPGHLLCVACRRDRRSGLQYPEAYFEPWDGPMTLPKASRPQPVGGGRYAPTRSGRIVVGTDLYDPPVPSLHTPQRQNPKR